MHADIKKVGVAFVFLFRAIFFLRYLSALRKNSEDAAAISAGETLCIALYWAHSVPRH